MSIAGQPVVSPIYVTLEPYLTAVRLAPYLASMNGDYKKSIQLYRWNIAVSGAMYEALHVFEVVLRNAMDLQLCAWNASQTDPVSGAAHRHDWLMDPSRLLARLVPADDRAMAKQRAAKFLPKGRTLVHADILAQMPLSAWRFLLPDNDPGRQLLWRDALAKSFPHLAMTPRELVDAVEGIYRMRNRVAHLEPLLRTASVKAQMQNIRDVLKAIDGDVESWFSSTQKVSSELQRQPQA